MTKVFIGLGSNLKQPKQQVLNAIEELEYLSHTEVLDVSPFYITKPVGYLKQPDFVNAVVKVNTKLDCFDLVRALQHIENKLGRIRDVVRNGPRTIDLDLLLFGKINIKTDSLIVPHPRMLVRGFVLYPLYDLEPNCFIFSKLDWNKFQQDNPRPKIIENIYEEVT